MKKTPSYKGGGTLIKGEPDKPVKTTIDKAKYKAALDKPISGEGTNVVGDSQDTFNPEVLKGMGYKYISGTMGGKDIVYEKDGNYHIYNEQPNAKQNKFGLINIGNPNAAPAITTKQTPTLTAPVVKPTINPNHKPLDFSNPNMVYDPNTGFYTNSTTGKMIEPIVEQYKDGGKIKGYFKKGGKVKGYADGGNTYANAFQQANPDIEQPIDQPVEQPKSGNANKVANTIGTGLGMYGTGYFANKDQTNATPQMNTRDKAMAIVGSLGAIGGAVAGLDAIGDKLGKPIKERSERVDENGNLIDPQAAKRNAIIGSFFSPSRALATRASYKGGWTDLTGKGYAKSLEDQAKQKLQAEHDAAVAAQADINKSRIDNAISQRDLGELGYQDNINLPPIPKAPTYAKGGVIKGAGTGTSDSIDAKVEEGTFIVPKKNAPIAEMIRSKMLNKNPKQPMTLKQGGGVKVKLSNGEHAFSPEEKAEIESYGIDLADLAPDADNEATEMKDGGLTAAKAKIILKDGTIRGKALTDKQKGYFGYIAGGRTPGKANGGEVMEYKKGTPREGVPSNKQAGIDLKNKMNKDLAEKQKLLAAQAKFESDLTNPKDPNKYYNQAALKGVKRRIEQINQLYGENATLPSDTPTASVSSIGKAAARKFAPVASTPSATGSKSKVVPTLSTEPKLDSPFSRDWATLNSGPDSVPPSVDPNLTAAKPAYSTAPTVNGADPNQAAFDRDTQEALNRNTPANTPVAAKKKFDFSNLLGTALNYGIPAAQIGIGLNQLKKAGNRPIDSLSADYLNSINQAQQNTNIAKQNAKYGYNPDELAAINMQNQNLTNDARYAARNLAGGSSAVALNLERGAINDAFGRNLMTKVQDKNLQLQKQQIANERQQYQDALIQDKQNRLRNYFGDNLNAWHEKTNSAAGLTNVGLTNLLDSYRADQRLKNFNENNPNTQQ